ncbi:relaxase/mobilization nuclease domain-containing protein [Pararhizobium sp. YC-54]|uniref:relaxase/mobilization nuclease domain-containing protein n=1 Tax=Pararhizobium sp. YC-54 TaxID=2986920 RepID=UPI0021F76389|nr:relaxase/mobilization nuclease domain-containing protein [Pararhizobium sp. YC-54]MCW0001563.1 relaxase/mobilization nuclease domain-containing protein [Pararhizobium sp. YC-54]
MAHDWAGLLGAIDIYSARRASSLIDEEDERRRRGRALGSAAGGEPAQKRYMPTGIARKGGRISTSSREPTVASVLRPAKSSQQEVIALIDALDTAQRRQEDDELRRRGSGGGGSAAATRIDQPKDYRRLAKDRASVEAASRAALAAGAQPVVIKVTSTVSSRASAAGLLTYLGTRETESEDGEKQKVDIPILDQDGVALASREDRAAVLADWVSEFREAYAVNAVATLSMTIDESVADDDLHDALNATFGSKPFLYARRPNGQVSVYAVTDLSAKKIAGALEARESGQGSARAVEDAETDFERRLAGAGIAADVRILGVAASNKSGRYFLEKFLRTEKRINTSADDPVKRGSSFKQTADGIWQDWSAHIRTVEPRNAFHVIFSARAGTDAEAMQRAVRDFLSEQVAGHRWITAHHPETGHVHVHAMISARDDVGKALRFTKPELYQWRERFAAKAREHGIAMVATRRADVAATRPYSQAQAGAYERGRSDPRYLKSPAVNKRVERKRAGVVDSASLSNGSLALAPKWQATATALKLAGAKPAVIEAAQRFATAAARKASHIAARPTKGFVLLRLATEGVADRQSMAATVQRAVGVDSQFVSMKGKTLVVLAPTAASVSKIERELARQNDEIGRAGETRSVVRDIERRLSQHGIRAAVSVEAAGAAKDSAPTPWLQNRFDTLSLAAGSEPAEPLREFVTLVSDIKQQKENAMPLSLEQFDERVARANKSMDRLETMVDSSTERQAVEEMRREVSALFAEQRRDIEMQQMRSVMETSGGGGAAPAARADDSRPQDRTPSSNVDPTVAAQQQAIAAGRAARAAREQASAAKGAQDELRREILRQSEQERQRDNGRDGAER